MKTPLIGLTLMLEAGAVLAQPLATDIYGRPLGDDRLTPPMLAPRLATVEAMKFTAEEDSGFTVGVAYKPGKTWIDAVGFGDVDGDGDMELVAVSSYYFDAENDYSVFVFHPTAAGLGEPTRIGYQATGNRNGLSIADLDGDGAEEIIVGHGQGLTIITQDGAGGFQTSLVGSAAADTLDAVDINRDGIPDLIGLPWSAPATQYFGAGDGSIAYQTTLATNASGYNDQALGDFNHDGVMDLAIMSGQGSGPDFSLHLHNGVDAFTAAMPFYLDLNDRASGIASGDFNGDGRDDLVIARGRNSPTYLWVYTQNAAGAMDTPVQLTSHDIPETLRAADLDGNGYDDILVLHGGWNTLGVYLNGPDGMGEETRVSIPYASHYDPEGLAVADTDGDGCPDMIAIADYNQGVVPVTFKLCETPPQPTTGSLEGSIGWEPVYHEVTVSGGKIDALLRFSGRRNDMDLYLYNPDGALVASAATNEAPEKLSYDTEGVAGTYKFKIVSRKSRVANFSLDYVYLP
ncbi:VCBS repeat-containing protein [Hahella aquimaris]|uniref:FG-GAP repeat domain-containing protein n=1 Tax=Hahella sp. HNIBRBA332 TaxID=3015983 RepID=UPI00273AB135|nr:VCBS repeat-containing protein [Hahella sp. HNIBRBA332]WLQ13622.1 VCBS repeat-containing protein [Hahella sp. HNIBRBA332]